VLRNQTIFFRQTKKVKEKQKSRQIKAEKIKAEKEKKVSK
jgi:hypothetical protein